MADGQVTRGNEVVKPNVKKVRKLNDNVIGGFAGRFCCYMKCIRKYAKRQIELSMTMLSPLYAMCELQEQLQMLLRFLKDWKCSLNSIQVGFLYVVCAGPYVAILLAWCFRATHKSCS